MDKEVEEKRGGQWADRGSPICSKLIRRWEESQQRGHTGRHAHSPLALCVSASLPSCLSDTYCCFFWTCSDTSLPPPYFCAVLLLCSSTSLSLITAKPNTRHLNSFTFYHLAVLARQYITNYMRCVRRRFEALLTLDNSLSVSLKTNMLPWLKRRLKAQQKSDGALLEIDIFRILQEKSTVAIAHALYLPGIFIPSVWKWLKVFCFFVFFHRHNVPAVWSILLSHNLITLPTDLLHDKQFPYLFWL